jgi:hypothetical protein
MTVPLQTRFICPGNAFFLFQGNFDKQYLNEYEGYQNGLQLKMTAWIGIIQG